MVNGEDGGGVEGASKHGICCSLSVAVLTIRLLLDPKGKTEVTQERRPEFPASVSTRVN